MITMYYSLYFRFVQIVRRKILNGHLYILEFIFVLTVLANIGSMELSTPLLSLLILMLGIENSCFLWKKVVTAGHFSISKKEELLLPIISTLTISHQLCSSTRLYSLNRSKWNWEGLRSSQFNKKKYQAIIAQRKIRDRKRLRFLQLRKSNQ